MTGQKEAALRGTDILRTLLIGALLSAAVLLLFGAVASLLIAKGVASLGQLNGISLAALFFGGLVSGAFAARRGKKMPLLWSVGTAAISAGLCILCGAALYEASAPDAVLKRLLAALLGGVCGGVLTALRKK